jgi:hypothetical protein
MKQEYESNDGKKPSMLTKIVAGATLLASAYGLTGCSGIDYRDIKSEDHRSAYHALENRTFGDLGQLVEEQNKEFYTAPEKKDVPQVKWGTYDLSDDEVAQKDMVASLEYFTQLATNAEKLSRDLSVVYRKTQIDISNQLTDDFIKAGDLSEEDAKGYVENMFNKVLETHGSRLVSAGKAKTALYDSLGNWEAHANALDMIERNLASYDPEFVEKFKAVKNIYTESAKDITEVLELQNVFEGSELGQINSDAMNNRQDLINRLYESRGLNGLDDIMEFAVNKQTTVDEETMTYGQFRDAKIKESGEIYKAQGDYWRLELANTRYEFASQVADDLTGKKLSSSEALSIILSYDELLTAMAVGDDKLTVDDKTIVDWTVDYILSAPRLLRDLGHMSDPETLVEFAEGDEEEAVRAGFKVKTGFTSTPIHPGENPAGALATAHFLKTLSQAAIIYFATADGSSGSPAPRGIGGGQTTGNGIR